ncbi:hypothetical protein CAAN1_20S01948 [[Candida] anglica]|uniref:Uncharacterized protein n=1 Tax=[Candida] anglica TaxID=148631 RepID=A0ABP0EJ79_9ASCO
MDGIHTALSLSLICERRIAIRSRPEIIENISESLLTPNDISTIVVDTKAKLDEDPESLNDIFENVSGHSIMFWTNADNCSTAQQKILIRLLNELDQYDTNESRWATGGEQQLNNHSDNAHGIMFSTSSIFSVILVIETPCNVIQPLRLKFWFCQYVPNKYNSDESRENSISLDDTDDYISSILRLRSKSVYMSPEIERYIYSLVIHARNHRLCSIAPMQSRLPTMAISNINLLAEALVKWENRNNEKSKLYITPDICKVAMRKVAYWLVNWQKIGGQFTEITGESYSQREFRESLEFGSLSGDWFGSDWTYIKKYIDECERQDRKMYNSVVEDVLKKVRPPI